MTQKLYRRHSGRPGGMKVETFNQLQQRIPERIIEHAIRGSFLKEGFNGNQIVYESSFYAVMLYLSWIGDKADIMCRHAVVLFKFCNDV
ncbi:hypothetical protein V6Z11_A11G303800 [Gossypium hirsutum]